MEERITIVPGVCGGRPAIRGMRITVTDVLKLTGGGMTLDEVLTDFPYLERQNIDACFRYAARLSSHRDVPALV